MSMPIEKVAFRHWNLAYGAVGKATSRSVARTGRMTAAQEHTVTGPDRHIDIGSILVVAKGHAAGLAGEAGHDAWRERRF